MHKSSGKNLKNKEENWDALFLKENNIIFKKYKPIKLIGKGAFSNIFSTIRLEDKSVFAMKVEKKSTLRKMLEIEAYHLYILQGFGIPKLITFGYNKNYEILIETLLGKSLYEIFIKTKKPCDLINACLIAIQLIERLEFIHSKNLIYRDVKPENFMTGIKDPNVLYITDFGLCKKYRSSKTGKHIQQRDTKKFSGTLKYSSADIVKGKEASRKDDLISLGYAIIYLYKRDLPWNSNFHSLNKKTYLELVKSKESNHNGEIFKNIPEEIENFVKYAQNLKFEEDPDYNYMKGLFRNLLSKNNYDIEKLNFCWINKNDENRRPLSKNKSNSKIKLRFRILENLKNRRLNSLQLTFEDELNNLKNNDINKDDKIERKNNLGSNVPDLTHKPNKTTDFSFLEKKDGIKLKNMKNINNYKNINDKKSKIPKYQIKKITNINNKKKTIPKIYTSLINKNKIKYNRITNNNHVYINSSNNIYLNFSNIDKDRDNNNFNEMRHIKANTFFNISNINDNMNINNMTNLDNSNNFVNININNDINKTDKDSRFKIRHNRYKPIFTGAQLEDPLYNSNIKNSIYKSNIKKDNFDFGNIKKINMRSNTGIIPENIIKKINLPTANRIYFPNFVTNRNYENEFLNL